jgi:hypothetical protein
MDSIERPLYREPPREGDRGIRLRLATIRTLAAAWATPPQSRTGRGAVLPPDDAPELRRVLKRIVALADGEAA